MLSNNRYIICHTSIGSSSNRCIVQDFLIYVLLFIGADQTRYGILIPIFILIMLIPSGFYAYVIGRRIYPEHLELFIMVVDKLGAVDKSENPSIEIRLD